MSLQLEILPQNHLGYVSPLAIQVQEVVSGGQNFSNFNSAGSLHNQSHCTTGYTCLPQSMSLSFNALGSVPPSLFPYSSWAWGSWFSRYLLAQVDLGATGQPEVTNGKLVLASNHNSPTEQTWTMVAQRLFVMPGQSYTLTVKLGTVTSGYTGSINKMAIGAYTTPNQFSPQNLGGNPLIASPTDITPVSNETYTREFIAQNLGDFVAVGYQGQNYDAIEIESISVTPTPHPAVLPPTQINGAVICDLYEDEDIPLSLSIDDFKNVAEKVQSYSKAFKLPATKRNSQLFDNIFEITRTASQNLSFNPYVKTQCILRQDGFTLFEGYLRLIDVVDKEGEVSYNVNLYSEAVALADFLEEKTLADLSLAELEHSYNLLNITATWPDTGAGISYLNPNTSGLRQQNITVKYPWCDWRHDYTIQSGQPFVPHFESSFRPFIQIKYLVDRIFADSPFDYTSDFFNTDDFKKLYMDFNWGNDDIDTNDDGYYGTWKYSSDTGTNVGDGTWKELRIIPEGQTGGIAGSTVPPSYDGSASPTYTFTSTTDNESYTIHYRFEIQVTNQLSSLGTPFVQCRWLKTTAGGVDTVLEYQNFQINNSGQTYSWAPYSGNFQVTLNVGDELKAQFLDDLSFVPGGVTPIFQQAINANKFSGMVVTVQTSVINSEVLLAMRGELGQWELLKGIMTMFNLISIPNKSNPNNITIEPYGDIFLNDTNCSATAQQTLACRSITHDWTDKIDITEIKLKPLTDLNKTTVLKFVEDDDDYAFSNYKKSVQGHLYGSRVYDASGLTILSGEKEIEAEPFAATVVKPLMSQYPDFIIPSIYAYNPDDDTSEGFDNAPRIMYNNGEQLINSCVPHVPAQNGSSAYNFDSYLQFSHLTDIPPSGIVTTTTRDFHFGACQLIPPIGNATPNNLFNNYWLPYLAELYNPDTRIMTIKVDLNAGDISTFNMYDTVFIKNREFRVNKIEYKPGDLSTVEFILIP